MLLFAFVVFQRLRSDCCFAESWRQFLEALLIAFLCGTRCVGGTSFRSTFPEHTKKSQKGAADFGVSVLATCVAREKTW